MAILQWQNTDGMESKSYTCGHCGNSLASALGYVAHRMRESQGEVIRRNAAAIYICHFCQKPSFFGDGEQIPGSVFGQDVGGLPETVGQLYTEARRCISVNSYTASILCSRKLLMNIAVSKGDEAGKSFVEYVNYLSDKGFVPPDSKEWVDHIRTKGNEATHEIKIMSPDDAKELISFLEMLMKFIYEFPLIMKGKNAGA